MGRQAKKLPISVPESRFLLPIFALTIGIDDYLYQGAIIKRLGGCVADANDVAALLIGTLGSPAGHVTNLRNEEATTSRIVAALERLATDPLIPKGSNIFIFYAGHGTEVLPPEGWIYNDKIQMMVTYDFYPGSCVSSHISGIGQDIWPDHITRNGLTDVRLNQLLKKIADEKGDNITVILDCCHSGSGTRWLGCEATRGIDLPEGTRIDCLSPSRGSMVLDKDRNKGLASHVLLAACNETQRAYERSGRGVFTSALTNLVRTTNLQVLTYSDIPRKLPKLSGQDPQCEGINKYRVFLNNSIASIGHTHYNLAERRAGDYAIDACKAGVTIGDGFIVYTDGASRTQLGCLTVYDIIASQAFLRPSTGNSSFDIPPTGAVAVQMRIGTRLRIIEPPNLDILSSRVVDALKELSVFDPTLEIVTTPEQKHDLVLTAIGDTANFEITDKVCRDAGMSNIPRLIEINGNTWPSVLRGVTNFFWNLHRGVKITDHKNHIDDAQWPKSVLRGVTDFFWNLNRTVENTERKARRTVDVLCYELAGGDIDDDFYPVMKPSSRNLVQHKRDMEPCDLIEVEVDDMEEKCYGFRINSRTTRPLFVSVFYFDMSDFSITPYYQPLTTTAEGHSPSLSPKGSLTIGYGDSGFPPKRYYLRCRQDIDIGYLKLFLSTTHVDYSNVPQDSPFLPQDRASRHKTHEIFLWDTLAIPIIQRRTRIRTGVGA